MKSKYKAYPSYKDSGIEWLGEIPEGWIKSKIKFFASIFGRIGFRGYTIADIVDEGKGAITLSPSNMKNNNMTYTKVTYLSWKKYYESPEIQIYEGDVVLVKTGSTFGKVGYINKLPQKMTLNPQLVVFKKLKGDSKYLYYLLNSKLIQAYIDNSNNGGTIPTMTQEAILNYEIPTPKYSEQQTIANYLDKATAKIDTLIEKQTKLIELLKEKRQAVISTAVTRGLNSTVAMKDSGVEWLGEIPEHWRKSYLKYIAKINMGQSPSSSTYNDEGRGIEFLQGNADFGEIHPTARTYTTEPKKISQFEDILFTVRAPVGAMNISDKKYAIGRGLCAISSTKHSKKSFLWWLMYIVKMELDTVATGSTYEAVSVEQVGNSFIALPSLSEQQEIANYLNNKTSKMDILMDKATKAIDLLKERRTALISAVVTGKIDVRKEN